MQDTITADDFENVKNVCCHGKHGNMISKCSGDHIVWEISRMFSKKSLMR